MRPKILVINSCGKQKQDVIDLDLRCHHLQTPQDRRDILKKYHDYLVPARELYTGTQAIAVNNAVNLLAMDHEVEYHIISAGFGLVSGNTGLVDYDCTFSGRSNSRIRELAEKLELVPKLSALLSKEYDVIFLILGKDYLQAINNLSLFSELSTPVYHFMRNVKQQSSNCFQVNESKYQNISVDQKVLFKPIGGLVGAKGRLLENYVIYLNKNELTIQDVKFEEWLYLVESQKNSQQSSNKIPRSSKNLVSKIQRLYGDHFLVKSEESVKAIRKRVAKYSNDQIHQLQQSGKHAKSYNESKENTRKAWINSTSEYHSVWSIIVDDFNELCDELTDLYDETKTAIKKEFVEQIKERQNDEGLAMYLMNVPKFAFIETIVSLVRDPKKLSTLPDEKVKPVKKTKKKKKVKKEDQNFDIDLIESVGEDEYTLILTNSTKTGFQDILIEFFDSEEDVLEIDTTSKNSDIISLESDNSIKFQFLKAPSEENDKYSISMNIKILDDFDNVKVKATYYSPGQGKEVTYDKEVF